MKTMESIFDEIPTMQEGKEIYIRLLDKEIKATKGKLGRLEKMMKQVISKFGGV